MNTCLTCRFLKRKDQVIKKLPKKVADDLMLCTQGWYSTNHLDGDAYLSGDWTDTHLFIPPQGFGCTFHEPVVES